MWIGMYHFINPNIFNEIVPDYLGAPSFWTYSSGVFEIVLGFGIMLPKTRVNASRALVALVLMMSLANLNMYINDLAFNGHRMGPTGHFIRLIVQLMLITTLLWLGAII